MKRQSKNIPKISKFIFLKSIILSIVNIKEEEVKKETRRKSKYWNKLTNFFIGIKGFKKLDTNYITGDVIYFSSFT